MVGISSLGPDVEARPVRVGRQFDLRSELHDETVCYVEQSLNVRLNRATAVRKRRTIGLRSDRETWVRLEMRPVSKIFGQGWNGIECASLIPGIAKPEWYRGISWRDRSRDAMWRADETELITTSPVKPGGILTAHPELSEAWWATFNASLTALADYATTRIATLHTEPMTQARLTTAINGVFPGRIDTTVDQWRASHADLNWANITAPDCYLLDWEDWGMAPRGLDAAYLWVNSLAVPDLAVRIHAERSSDLDSRSGKLARLYFCCEIMAAPGDYRGSILEPAERAATQLVYDLSS